VRGCFSLPFKERARACSVPDTGVGDGFKVEMAASFLGYCRQIITDMGTAQRESLVSLTCLEVQELENIFALLLMGSFIGLPAPPTFLSVELLPFMEREMRILHQRAEDAHDMLAEIMGTLGID
jgi:hypothetical protein